MTTSIQGDIVFDDTETYANTPTATSQLLPGRKVTFPHRQLLHRKPRRWPLVLRFIKGAIHGDIFVATALHALFTTVIVLVSIYLQLGDFGFPASIVPSLSIVVGLMLVFRNQTSYQRFWDGRNNLAVVITSVRNLSRSFLACSGPRRKSEGFSDAERRDVERTVRILMALPASIKNTLRAEWGAFTSDQGQAQLLPSGLRAHEDEGLALPIQLVLLVEAFIARGHDRGWFHAPQASQLTVQVNTLVDAFGRMETIRLTQFPVAILIHQRQVLALFGCVLPFAVINESLRWWAVPIVALIMFTFYGIEAIACQLEDPFGYDRNDIKMDDIVEDLRVEMGVLLDEWRASTRGPFWRPMFVEDM